MCAQVWVGGLHIAGTESIGVGGDGAGTCLKLWTWALKEKAFVKAPICPWHKHEVAPC